MSESRFRSALALAAALVASPSAAQERAAPENLQVLPADMTRQEVTRVMRGFSFATGYRCSDCHVGEEGQPLSTYDFASDDLVLKQKARDMLRMVNAINAEHLASLPDRGEPAVAVTCMTCHGGVARPEPIEAIVERVTVEEGVDEAVARYRALREEYLGGRAYDFGERPLVEAGTALARDERAEDAVVVLELAREYYPESAQAMLGLGEVHEMLGNTEEAIAAYRRVLELAPGHPGAERRLAALGGGG
jgi:tetratricopeptide (TPR) repeat protein